MSEKFRVARYKASKLQSHFAHGFFSLIPVPLKGLGTCGVDEKHHFYYDPDVCEKWSNEDWITGIFHELWHLLLDHKKRGERFAGESPAAKTRWNICGDLELAQHIKEAQLKFLETDLTPDKFGLPWGLTAEEYWHLLPAATKDSSNCGSGSGGTSYEGEIKGEGISSFEAAAVRKTVAEAIKKIGNAPGGLSRWADSVLSPKVNWKEQLKAVVCRQLRDIGTKNQQNSWLRLNRRQALFGDRKSVV